MDRTITILGSPVPWKRAQRGKYGNSYTDPACTFQMEKVRAAARNAGYRKAKAVPFLLTCRFYRPDMDPWAPHFGDYDNCVKLVKDALEDIVWTNDRWVIQMGPGGKYRDSGKARTELEIEEIPNEENAMPVSARIPTARKAQPR